eukprot:6205694-Pleurochrysis_carterae.AAC.2
MASLTDDMCNQLNVHAALQSSSRSHPSHRSTCILVRAQLRGCIEEGKLGPRRASRKNAANSVRQGGARARAALPTRSTPRMLTSACRAHRDVAAQAVGICDHET